MIIDMHAHMAYFKCYPGYFLDGMTENFQNSRAPDEGIKIDKNLVRNVTIATLKDQNCAKLVKQMDEAGITKAVLLILDLGFESGDSLQYIAEIHQLYHQVLDKYPEKFIVFSGIDPRRGVKGLELFEKGIKEYNFKGFKLYPPCGYELNDSRLMPYYELCKQYGLPVLTHTGPSLKNMKNDYDYVTAMFELSERFRDIIFILAHATYSDLPANIRLARERENIFLDLSAFQVHLDKPAILTERVKQLFREVPKKILFGTDWPVYRLQGGQKNWVNFFRNLDFLDIHQLEMFFYKNAGNVIQV